jgi:sugar phosphate isomerase/epimerase
MSIQIAISSWTVHGLLGQAWHEPDDNWTMVNKNAGQDASLSLLDLPAHMANDDIYVLELCNFHLPAVDDDYLAQLKSAMESAGVTLANLLIDTGNLSSLDDQQWRSDIEQTKRWQDVAAKLGAKGTRIDCGTEPATPETMERSASALRELVDYGESLGLHTTTENWRTTSVEPENLFHIMEKVERSLKLCVDFGNAEKTADKYATLEQLMPYANSIHCKGHFDGMKLDTEEFNQSLDFIKRYDFDGHISLIDDGIDNEWDRVLTLKEQVEAQLL